MEVKVREREYEVAVEGTHINALRTENIWTCISLAGVNDQGVGFLCHFDRSCTVDGLPKVIKALEGVTDDFDTFKLKIIAAGLLGPTYNCWTHRKLRKALEQMGVFNTPTPETTVVSPGVYNWRMKCGVVVNTESREITITPPHLPFIDYNRYTQFKKSYKWYNYFDGICDCELIRTSMRPGYDKD